MARRHHPPSYPDVSLSDINTNPPQHKKAVICHHLRTRFPRASTATKTSHAILYRCLLPKTSVFTLAELLAGFGSKLGELTTTVFVVDAGIGSFETRTVKLTVAEAP